MSVEEVAGVVRRDVRERLLAGGGSSIDRLPLLRVVLDDMACGFEKEMQRLVDPSLRCSIESVTSGRAGDIFGAFDRCAAVAAYEGVDPDSKMLVGAGHGFVFSLVEAMLGSDGSAPPFEEARSLTKIEIRIAQLAFGKLARALVASFASIADAAFPMRPVDGDPDLAVLGRRGGFAMMCRCRLAAFGREGAILFAVPQSIIDSFREALSHDATATISTTDPHWAKRMKDRVTQTEVTLQAVMEKTDITLAEIAGFEVGQIVELPISPTSLIKLESEGQALFWCELGQKDGAYTIRIEDFVDQNQEFIDDVLGG
jgi:flagellar motor switch protein FliM